MFMADYLTLETKRVKLASNEVREQISGCITQGTFPYCRFRHSTWTVDTKQCDFKGKEDDGP